MIRLILASASPRRRELLSLLPVEFEVRPVDIDEDPGTASDPQIVARRLARLKAEAARLIDETSPILAADTIVWFEGRSIGKPADADEAREMLRMLRGKTHEVVSAVAFMPERRRSAIIRHPVTKVRLREFSDDEIESTIARGEPFDKAGGYAIQDDVLSPIEAYRGCYCNVVGMSLLETLSILRKGGIKLESARLLPQCDACPFAGSGQIYSPARA